MQTVRELYRTLGVPERYQRIRLHATLRLWRDKLWVRYGACEATTVFLRSPAYLYRPLGSGWI